MKAATSIFVPVLTVNQLREIQLIRHLLEGEAAGMAAQRITKPELEKLEAIRWRTRGCWWKSSVWQCGKLVKSEVSLSLSILP
jgi:hypothetical protein